MIVSIIDIQSPAEMAAVVRVADASGFHRYWASEHHQPEMSGSPTLAAAYAGSLCTRLRVGTGGVALRGQSPYRVAADVALLRTLLPGRIDVGIVGARMREEVALAMTGAPVADDDTFRARIVELLRLTGADAPVPCGGLATDAEPELWIGGGGPESAVLAGSLGMRYAFHHQLAGHMPYARSIAAMYRASFQPRRPADAPCFAIVAFGAIGFASGQLWAGERGEMDGPSFLGPVGDCAEQIAALVDRYRADEVMLDCFYDKQPAARLDALGTLAQALGLSASGASA